MQRRAFIKIITCSAFDRAFAARAQQPTMPVLGFLSSRSPGESARAVAAFRQGLRETGFVDGQNSELVNLPLALLFAAGPSAALAANPIAAGLVESFNKPGGNATGMTLITGPLAQKRLELLREIAPKAVNLAMLANPLSPDAAPEIRDVQASRC